MPRRQIPCIGSKDMAVSMLDTQRPTKNGTKSGLGGSGPLLCMAQVLVPLGRLLMSMLTIILLVEYYTLKQAAEIELVVKPVSMSLSQWQSGSRLK
jgi:hypothetical protein